ncbi:MAG: Hpt domain-containing protein [Rhodospirillaceae bacterium]
MGTGAGDGSLCWPVVCKDADTCDDRVCGATSVVFDSGVLDDLATVLDDVELDAYLVLLESTVLPRVAQLQVQLAAGEYEGMEATAHGLNGGAGCYGLVALSAHARLIEVSVRVGDLWILPNAVAEVAEMVAASLTAVTSWRCRLKNDGQVKTVASVGNQAPID